MSGGHFDYKQYEIDNIADEIESLLERQGKAIDSEYNYFDNAEYEVFEADMQQRFVEAIKVLRTAAIYAQRIDWYLSGDDGEESFLERLKEELEVLNGKN